MYIDKHLFVRDLLLTDGLSKQVFRSKVTIFFLSFLYLQYLLLYLSSFSKKPSVKLNYVE